MLLKLVNDRRAQSKLGGVEKKDLLEMILESAARDNSHNTDMPHYRRKTDRFILDNCRNIYFAGSETTALTVSWTLMLLSLHPEWQERIRAEIVEVCGDHELYHCLQDMDIVRKFKTVLLKFSSPYFSFSRSKTIHKTMCTLVHLACWSLMRSLFLFNKI